MAKRLNKNDIIRGRIFDKIAEQFGNSVLGLYDGKLRIEIIDDETDEVVQFSLAPTVHKVLVDESECDEYISIEDRVKEYQSSLKKNETKKPKKPKKESMVETAIPAATKEENFESKESVITPKSTQVNTMLTDDEQSKIDELMNEVGGFDF